MAQHPHDYGCTCRQCRAMIAAIAAEDPDGTPFFSERELYELALRNNEPMPESDEDECPR